MRRDAAILSATSWTVNGSSTEGKKMVRDFSKLMLRAYNAEADNCVRTMKPHRLVSSIERLTKARDQIAKLGATMHIRIDAGYHSVRVQELGLTADYLAKQDEEKERQRAERERQRDEEAARKSRRLGRAISPATAETLTQLMMETVTSSQVAARSAERPSTIPAADGCSELHGRRRPRRTDEGPRAADPRGRVPAPSGIACRDLASGRSFLAPNGHQQPPVRGRPR